MLLLGTSKRYLPDKTYSLFKDISLNITQTHWRPYFIQIKVMQLAISKGCTPML